LSTGTVRNRAAAGVLALTLCIMLLAVACDDGNDTPDDPSSSATANSTGSPVETPTGNTDNTEDPEECEVSDEAIGLVSKLDFMTPDGVFEQGGQFAPGTPVDARMRLINCSEEEANLYFDTTQRYEMTVESESGTEVFRSSDGMEFADTKGTETLQAGDMIVYEETWDQTDKEGQSVPPGIYSVSFLSVGCGSETGGCNPFGPGGLIEILE